MKLKALREKKDVLLNQLEEMVSGLEGEAGEVRSLTEEERNAFDVKKAEIDAIDETITRIENTRAKNLGKEAVEELSEKRSKEEMEKRAVENFFRGMDLEKEERTILASNSANQALMPLEISKTIMQKLEELVPVLELARRFSSKGTLRLIKEDSYGAAGLTAENTQFKDADVTFKTVELKSYKISASVQATFEMLANTDINLSNYLLDVIVRRLAKELNKYFIVGTGSNEPQGLVNGTLTQEVKAEPTIEDFIAMQTAMNPAYLDKACWIVNRKSFQKMAQLLDGTGRPYLTNNVINDKIQYSLLGVPVLVDANMADFENGNKPIILVNIGEAYSINILTDITIRHLVENGFTQGLETFAGYVLADGKIVNDDAMVVGTAVDQLSVLAAKKKK